MTTKSAFLTASEESFASDVHKLVIVDAAATIERPTMSFKLLLLFLSVCTLVLFPLRADEPAGEPTREAFPSPTNATEARARARLLHETIHGSLQVVHRDFFDEENTHDIPSASLEDVFAELAKTYNVRLKWLIVETDIINVDHQPEDEFELAAVKALKSGEASHEAIEEARYRFAGRIRLASQCLKCHVKHRTSTEDRTAGLSISMPLQRSR